MRARRPRGTAAYASTTEDLEARRVGLVVTGSRRLWLAQVSHGDVSLTSKRAAPCLMPEPLSTLPCRRA
jgi:hypothetical protein